MLKGQLLKAMVVASAAIAWAHVAEAGVVRSHEIRYSGSGVNEDGFDTAEVDAYGNLYAAGWTTVGGNFDALLVRRSPGGQQWVRTFGSTVGNDYFFDMALDSAGNAYCIGIQRTATSSDDLMIAKVSPSGTVLWTRTWSQTASSIDRGVGVAVDAAGNAYVVASTAVGSNWNWALLKWNRNGDFRWARTSGGTRFDVPAGIALDREENPYIVGFVSNESTPFNRIARIEKWTSDGVLAWRRDHPSIHNKDTSAVDVAVSPTAGTVVMAINQFDLLDRSFVRMVEYRPDGVETRSISVTNWELGSVSVSGIAPDPSSALLWVSGWNQDQGRSRDLFAGFYNTAFAAPRWFDLNGGLDTGNDIATTPERSAVVAGTMGQSPAAYARVMVLNRRGREQILYQSPAPGDNAAVSSRANLFGDVAVAGRISGPTNGTDAWAIAFRNDGVRTDIDQAGCVDDEDLTEMILEYGNHVEIATAGADGWVRFFSSFDGAPRGGEQLGGATQGDVRYSRNGRWYASRTGDKTLVVRNRQTLQTMYNVSLPETIQDFDFSHRSDYLVVVDNSGVRKFDATSGVAAGANLAGAGGRKLAFSVDGNNLAVAWNNGSIILFNLYSLALFDSLVTNHGLNPQIAWSPKNDRFATGGANGRVHVILTDRTALGSPLLNIGEIKSLDFSPDGALLAVGGSNGGIVLLNSDGAFVANMPGHTGEVTGLKFSTDGQVLFSTGADKILRAASVASRTTRWTRPIPATGSVMMDISPTSPADVNLDGTVDEGDLTEVILTFGNGCYTY